MKIQKQHVCRRLLNESINTDQRDFHVENTQFEILLLISLKLFNLLKRKFRPWERQRCCEILLNFELEFASGTSFFFLTFAKCRLFGILSKGETDTGVLIKYILHRVRLTSTQHSQWRMPALTKICILFTSLFQSILFYDNHQNYLVYINLILYLYIKKINK